MDDEFDFEALCNIVKDMRREFLECAVYDVLMEGPKFKNWNLSSLNRLRIKYEKLQKYDG